MAIVLAPVSGTGTAIDLVTSAQAQTALPNLAAAQLADLPAVITAVSRAIKNECGRHLALTSFDKVYRPGRTRKIYLDAWPIAPGTLTRLKTDLVVALAIENTDSVTNQAATVMMTPTNVGQPYNPGPPATLVLNRLASGTWTPNTLTLANYTTLAALVSAINALGGGWQALVGNNLGPSTNVQIQNLSPSELNYDGGATGALQAQCELRWYSRDITRYVLHDDTGMIELTENRPESFRYGDRAFGIGYGWSWSAAAEPRHAGVRAIYRAGFAVQPADVSAGYHPVPDDLARATILAIQACFEATAAPDRQKETAGKFNYEKVAEGPRVLSQSVRMLLGPYYNKQIF